MKSRAAIAVGAGKPLSIEEIDVEGPRAGEVLVEIRATGVCHTDAFTLSGADPEGLSRCARTRPSRPFVTSAAASPWAFSRCRIRIDDLITHRLPLADINRAFDLMHRGESIRSVVSF